MSHRREPLSQLGHRLMELGVMRHPERAEPDGWRQPFSVGQVLDNSVEFTPESVSAFATLAHDSNPLHHDEALASDTRFGGLIACGAQTTGFMLGSLSGHLFPGSASLGLDCAFKLVRAVPARCRMRVRWTVTTITPKPALSGVIATLEGDLQDEDGAVFVRATATIVIMPPDALRLSPAVPLGGART